MKKVKLTSICNPKQWKTIPVSKLTDIGYPVYGANGIIGYFSEYNHENETIAITCRGATCGTVNMTQPKSYVNGNAMCLDDIDDNIRIKYLFYSMQSYDFAKIISGSAQPQITREGIQKVEIVIHSLDEQEKIIRELDMIQRLIDQRRTQIEKMDNLMRSRFIEMFGDPIANDKEWLKTTLHGSLEKGRTVSYGIVQTGDEVEDGIPVFRPIDIAGGHIPKREELKKTLPEISAKYQRTVLNGRELLVTVRGSVGETFQVGEEFAGCNVGRNIVPLITDQKKVNQRFLQELFAQEAIKRWLKSITKGIALQGLNMSEFKEMPVIAPPITLQNEFAMFAKQTDKSKYLFYRLEYIRNNFNAMLEFYMGG